MVVIFSTSQGDPSTCEVIDWLAHKKCSFERINLDDIYSFSNISIQISSSAEKINPAKEKSNVFWFRRGNCALHNESINEQSDGNNALIEFQLNELDQIIEYFLSEPNDSFWLNKPSRATVNKLVVLDIAKDFFRIPETAVTNSKAELFKFKQKHDQIITKPLGKNIPFTLNNNRYMQYTSIVDDGAIERQNQKIFPCLIQESIQKEYEIRSFFIEGDIYSMAIFSQRNSKTQVDFRNYDVEKQNRYVPYKLCKADEEKVSLLMQKLELNSGSIDFIKSKNGDLVFLEVNPVGQYDMISKPCNYYLSEKIADTLIRKSINKK